MRVAWVMVLLGLSACSLLLDAPPPLLSPDADAGVLDPCASQACIDDPLKSTCALVDGQAVCVCDPGLISVGGTCAPQREGCAADDCMAAARSIERGEATADDLAPGEGDEADWFVLSEPSVGGIEGVEVSVAAADLPPVLEFFTAPEDAFALARSEDGVLRAEVPVGAILFVRVSFANAAYSAYSLTTEYIGSDDYPDRSQDAQLLGEGTHPFSLETVDDVDVIAIEHSQAGALFVGVELPFSERSREVRLRLREDGSGGEYAYFGRAVRSVQPGRTVVRIDHPQGERVSGSLVVALWQGDDHGDDLNLATPLALSRVSPGVLEVDGDSDWFVFSGEHRRVYEVVVNAGQAVGAALFDGVAEAPYWARSGPGARSSHPRRSGPAYLRIDGEPGDYTVLVLDTGLVDDVGDSSADVTALGDELQAGAIDYVHDEDWFGLTVFIGGAWQMRFADLRPDLALTLRSADDTVVAIGAADGSGIEATLDLGTEYFLVVAARTPAEQTPPGYQVQACFGPCDDDG
jgi:hypothetical protein